MVNINGLFIDATILDILQELKRQLHAVGVNKLNTIRDSGNNVMITCPNHKDGQEKKPSCGVEKETGVVHCLACGYAVSLNEMISNVFGYSDGGIFGFEWLKKNFLNLEVDERPDIKIDTNRHQLSHKQYTYVPDMVLDQYRYTHPYMYKRKMTDEVIEQFDIGYDKETDCLTFPVRNRNGDCVFVARRSVKTKYFNYPSAVEKPLYGIYELLQWSIQNNINLENVDLVVCESMINCITCWTHGVPAIALNGTGSEEQLHAMMNLSNRKLIIALDPDAAGRHGMERIVRYVKGKMLYTVDYKDDRDINDLSDEEFDELMKTTYIL